MITVKEAEKSNAIDNLIQAIRLISGAMPQLQEEDKIDDMTYSKLVQMVDFLTQICKTGD